MLCKIINSLLVHEYLDHWLEDVNGPGEPMDEIEAAAKLELLLTLVRIAQQPHIDEGMSIL